MTHIDTTAQPASSGQPVSADASTIVERRYEPRQPITCDLWMIDHHGSTVLRCHCYGVAEGQRYELRSHLPGTRGVADLGLVNSRWATVVRTRVCLEDAEDHLDIGVVLDSAEASFSYLR